MVEFSDTEKRSGFLSFYSRVVFTKLVTNFLTIRSTSVSYHDILMIVSKVYDVFVIRN